MRSVLLIKNIDIKILGLAIILYGAFSSPTPDGFSFDVVIIGLLLTLSVALSLTYVDVSRFRRGGGFYLYALIAFVFGALFGISNEFGQFLRDSIAFFFLIIGLVLFRAYKVNALNIIENSIICGGIFISLRFLLEAGFSFSGLYEVAFRFDGFQKLNTDLLIPLSVIVACKKFIVRRIGVSTSSIVMLAVIVFLPLLVLFTSGLRGPLLISLMSIYIAFSKIYESGYRKYAIMTVFYLIVSVVLLDQFEKGLFNSLLEKNESAGGASNKVNEFYFVLDQIVSSPKILIFGAGLGSYIEVLDGVFFPFCHNFSLYLWYKAGFIGLICSVLMIMSVVQMFVKSYKFYGLEYLPPLILIMYGLVVNPVFKYFSFGILLLWFFSMAEQDENRIR